jgi:uncharacterized membrane protein YkvA (DUF1232 family)
MEETRKLSLAGKVLNYIRDPAVAVWRKGAGLLAAVYVISPVDIVPDVLPLLGWLDDLGVVSAVAWFLIRDIRKHADRAALPPPSDPPGAGS